MKCPYCGNDNTRVIDSRPADDNSSIRRRRICDDCNKRFTTYEKVETIPLIIIKKDNNRETYDRSKIESGVLRACHKRPVSAMQITKLVDDVENDISQMEEKEIPSDVIGELVLEAASGSNKLTANGDNSNRELVNLILGKTEVAKAEILSVVSEDTDFESKKQKIEVIKAETLDYFKSILAQLG